MRLINKVLQKSIVAVGKVFPVAKRIAYEREVSAARVVAASSVYPLPANFADLPPATQVLLDELYKSPLELPARQLYLLKNVCVSSHGVVFKNLSIFVPSLVYPNLISQYQGTLLLKQWAGSASLAEDVPLALIYDHWSSINYFHWVIEALPRLMVLRQQEVAFRLVMPEALPAFARESLALFGCGSYQTLADGQVAKVKALWSVDHLSNYWLYDAGLLQQFRSLLHNLGGARESKPFRKVYASRSKARYRKIVNEAEVEELVQQQGFEVVFFEDLAFTAQMRLMHETKLLLGIHGASLTNLVFMQPGSAVMELMNEEHANLAYFKLAAACGVHHQFLPEANASPRVDNNANIRVDIDELTRQLLSLG